MGTLDLRGMTPSQLGQRLIPAVLPRAEQHQRYYGRSLNPAQIERALLDAKAGLMVDLTDLEDESLGLDLHASGVLRKSFSEVKHIDQDIVAAKGRNIDETLAEEIADAVRLMLAAIPKFEDRIEDLAWGLYHGRAALEVHWKVSRGDIKWTVEDLAWIYPRRISYGPERELRIVDTWSRRGNFVKDGFAMRDFPGKFLTLQANIFRVPPEQDGLAPRLLYWSFFKRFGWRMRMVLTELFAVPWRIIEVADGQRVDWDVLKEAGKMVEKLGRENTASLPPGAKLKVVSPDGKSADLFRMTDEDVDKQVSRFVLGNTGTTDGETNRANGIIAKGEQGIFTASNAGAVSASIQELVEAFVLLNWGDRGMAVCPKFKLHTKPARDVDKELTIAQKVVGMGLPVAEQQIRELTGLRRPDDDETSVTSSGLSESGDDPLDGDPDDEEDVDDVAAKAGELEEGGEDKAAANAVADLLAAANIRLSADAIEGLAALTRKGRSDMVKHLLLEQARKADAGAGGASDAATFPG